MPKILIAGLGSIGRRHLWNLSALGCTDFVLLRTNQSTLDERELPDHPTANSLEAALEQAPDIAIISNPTSLHLETARACAQAGCHLLIEKPVSHTRDGCAQLQQQIARQGLSARVGFQFRFHPGLSQIKSWLEQDVLGSIISASARYAEYLPNWHPWEDYRQSYTARAELGGGAILTLCHPIDYLCWLLGRVKGVNAMIGERGGLEMDVEDTAEITLAFESGVTAQIHLDCVQQPTEHWLQVTGQRGTAFCDFVDGSVRLYLAASQTWQEVGLPPGFERNTMFVDEVRHLLHTLDRDITPACSLAEGIAVLDVALAAKEAASANKTIWI